MFNRRYAFLGWLAWAVGKRVVKRKARTAVPALDPETRRPNRPAVLVALATLGLGAWLARGYLAGRDDEDGGPAADA